MLEEATLTTRCASDFPNKPIEVLLSNLAFPHHKNPPSRLDQCLSVLLVPGFVSSQLRDPIFAVAFGEPRSSAQVMSVPKAPVDENNGGVS